MSDQFKVSGHKFALKPLSKEEGQWKFTHRPGGWIIAEGPGGERRRFAIHELRGKLSVNLGKFLHFGDIVAERKHGSGGAHGGDTDLTAQFPGKVRKIIATEGSQVKAGDPLVLVEAMKMEFTIKAPSDGFVKKLLVKEGQQLSPGDHFFEFIEAAEAGGEK